MAEPIVDTGGAMSAALIAKSVPKAEFSDQALEELKRKEGIYIGSVLSLFATVKEPKRWDSPFVADFSTVGTTREDAKKRVGLVLEKGRDFYNGLKEGTAFSIANERQLTLYERALAYVQGDRKNSDSYFVAVDQLAQMVIFLSKEELKDRVDREYQSEGGDRELFIGRVVKGGKMSVLSASKEKSITGYQKDVEQHAYQVAMLATDGLKIPDRLK